MMSLYLSTLQSLTSRIGWMRIKSNVAFISIYVTLTSGPWEQKDITLEIPSGG